MALASKSGTMTTAPPPVYRSNWRRWRSPRRKPCLASSRWCYCCSYNRLLHSKRQWRPVRERLPAPRVRTVAIVATVRRKVRLAAFANRKGDARNLGQSTAQLISILMSAAALILSLAALILNYRNTKLNRHLDALQRRTSVLIRLIDSQSKATALKVKLNDTKRSLSRFEARREASPIFKIVNLPGFKEASQAFEAAAAMLTDMPAMVVGMENQLSDVDKILRSLRDRCDRFNESTDSREIEKLHLLAHELETKIITVSADVGSAQNHIDGAHKTIDSLETQLRSLEAQLRSLPLEAIQALPLDARRALEELFSSKSDPEEGTGSQYEGRS